ncbi:hypothetical protein [Arhodomonas sp. AD133]|uniref:hypothetical protein n=1 Tax=Arhodomonas sp. AD133 TaxID=3415009 RepID=UPI003EBF422F
MGQEPGGHSRENMGQALVDSVFSESGRDFVSTVTETALDAAMDSGVLKDIPFVGILAKIWNLGNTIDNKVFMKKVAFFLESAKQSCGQVPSHEVRKLQSDPSYRRRVGEGLILLLQQQDHFDKASILGKVYAGCLRGDIDYDMFQRLASVINNTFIGDLHELEDYYKRIDQYDPTLRRPFKEFLDDAIAQSLQGSGLVIAEGYTEDIYHPSESGRTLVKLLKN